MYDRRFTKYVKRLPVCMYKGKAKPLVFTYKSTTSIYFSMYHAQKDWMSLCLSSKVLKLDYSIIKVR